jgi:hypothetical protein
MHILGRFFFDADESQLVVRVFSKKYLLNWGEVGVCSNGKECDGGEGGH